MYAKSEMRRISVVAGYLGFAMIVVLSLLPAQTRPHTGVGGEYEHWIAYALVGGAFAAGYCATRERLIAGSALTASAAVLELLQNLIPGRTAELAGFLAGSLGAWIGIFLVVLTATFQRSQLKCGQLVHFCSFCPLLRKQRNLFTTSAFNGMAR